MHIMIDLETMGTRPNATVHNAANPAQMEY